MFAHTMITAAKASPNSPITPRDMLLDSEFRFDVRIEDETERKAIRRTSPLQEAKLASVTARREQSTGNLHFFVQYNDENNDIVTDKYESDEAAAIALQILLNAYAAEFNNAYAAYIVSEIETTEVTTEEAPAPAQTETETYTLVQDDNYKPTSKQRDYAAHLARQLRDAGVGASASTLSKYYRIDALKSALAVLQRGGTVIVK